MYIVYRFIHTDAIYVPLIKPIYTKMGEAL